MDELLLAEKSELRNIYEMWSLKKRTSFLFCGPAGSGKTSFIKILFSQYEGRREEVNAVDVGIPKLREIIKTADDHFRFHGEATLLFIDEAHRLRAPQQDILLPGLELGSVLLLAATTENPGFRFGRAFLSRLRLVQLEPLSEENLKKLMKKGLDHVDFTESFPESVESVLQIRCNGDGRKLLGDLYSVVNLFGGAGDFDEEAALKYLNLRPSSPGSKHLKIDALSALIKSMRASDEKASVYYMGVLLEANEDPEIMLRRMLIFSSEDVGNANPQAAVFINALWDGFKKVGEPEALYSLYQGCSYLAKSPKSRRHVEQKTWVDQVVCGQIERLAIPAHLKNKGQGPIEGVSNLPKCLTGSRSEK